MLIKQKKGWIRIVEAVFAIVLLTSIIIIFTTTTTERPDIAPTIHQLERAILEEIAKNDEIRDITLSNITDAEKKQKIEKFARELLPPSLRTNFGICVSEILEICPDMPKKGELYVEDIIISSSKSHPDGPPKKISIYIWLE